MSFSYAPFGEIIEATDGGGSSGLAAHRRRYNDKFSDELSGLTYYGARYYDKTSMTWTQGDPLYRLAPDGAWSQPRRSNLYAHSLQNPLYADPDGRYPAAEVLNPNDVDPNDVAAFGAFVGSLATGEVLLPVAAVVAVVAAVISGDAPGCPSMTGVCGGLHLSLDQSEDRRLELSGLDPLPASSGHAEPVLVGQHDTWA